MPPKNVGKELADKLDVALAEQGFKRRGKAFFRVIGDGVLQAIRFQYELHGQYQELCIGLDSLYADLSDSDLTSSGCFFVGYPAVLFIGKRWSCGAVGSGLRYDVLPDEQIRILIEKVLPWMNSITTQQLLATGLCYLDYLERCGRVLWHDTRKYTPFLRAGDFDAAARVMQAILTQHVRGTDRFQHDGTEECYQKLFDQMDDKDQKLLHLLHIAKTQDMAAIEAYLQSNYDANLKRAKFCMR